VVFPSWRLVYRMNSLATISVPNTIGSTHGRCRLLYPKCPTIRSPMAGHTHPILVVRRQGFTWNEDNRPIACQDLLPIRIRIRSGIKPTRRNLPMGRVVLQRIRLELSTNGGPDLYRDGEPHRERIPWTGLQGVGKFGVDHRARRHGRPLWWKEHRVDDPH